jgi:hypothetical protein
MEADHANRGRVDGGDKLLGREKAKIVPTSIREDVSAAWENIE